MAIGLTKQRGKDFADSGFAGLWMQKEVFRFHGLDFHAVEVIGSFRQMLANEIGGVGERLVTETPKSC